MNKLINPDKIDSCVIQATENTFAEFVFMDALHMEKCEKDFETPLTTQILIHHPFCGEIELTADEALIVKMAENIMMIPPEELNDTQKQDILFELLNTLGGRILALILPENLTFKLGLPETTESFMERDNDIYRIYDFLLDDQYRCRISFLAEL